MIEEKKSRMTVEKAVDLIEMDAKCSEHAIACANQKKACAVCELYVDTYELDDARELSFRILKAWKSTKEEIKKTCGCSTAYDIMEKYEKEVET